MTGFNSKREAAADKVQEPVAHLWECLGRWSAYLVENGKQADCSPPSWLVDAINKATTPPLPEQEPVAQGSKEHLKIMMEHSAWDDRLELSDALANIDDFYATAPPQPEQEPDALTIAYQSGYYDGKQAALAGREWNFCERCGKRTADIHTCTPPQ